MDGTGDLTPSATRSALVIGDLDVTRRVCRALSADGLAVVHLTAPTDAELAAALDQRVDIAAVLVRGDVTALRYALLVEHLCPRVRLVVTLFDRTISAQLTATVPNCVVSSPADIAVPSIIGACLGGGLVAVMPGPDGAGTAVRRQAGDLCAATWHTPGSRLHRAAGLLRSQVRPHDNTTRILLGGGLGMLAIIALDWLLSVSALHEGALDALYSATRIVTAVGPADADHAPGWYLAFSSLAMLATLGFAALFTAGVVNRVRSARSVGLVGRRTVPVRDHVVVIGLGQVGLRLCIRLAQLGIPVVAVEREAGAANLRLAKALQIPVVLGHGEDRAVLRRLHLNRALALAAMGSEELDNVEVVIAALAVEPGLRVVLRAGEDDVIRETRSLFRIGEVVDVSALTTQAVLHHLNGDEVEVIADGPRVTVWPAQAELRELADAGHCACR